MVAVDIPYFKEVIIMAVSCDACGYKNNEVKGKILYLEWD
jgi:zinc finger protein